MNSELISRPAGSPDRNATSASPCDSPDVKNFSISLGLYPIASVARATYGGYVHPILGDWCSPDRLDNMNSKSRTAKREAGREPIGVCVSQLSRQLLQAVLDFEFM